MPKTETHKQETAMGSLREELVGTQSGDGFSLKRREVSVMTRLAKATVEIIDALVELEIFNSRSEAVAAFVEEAILTQTKKFEEIKAQAKEIGLKREKAKAIAMKAMSELE
jgi:Arc/MetJ-type ribon-helix-helix transcriptional regulator